MRRRKGKRECPGRSKVKIRNKKSKDGERKEGRKEKE